MRVANGVMAALFLCETARGAGYEFEGVGARAVGRGGAMIAASDDWTAMYWNPANMAAATRNGQREAGVEIFGGEAHAEDSNSLSNLPGISGFSDNDIKSPYVLAALGAAIPVGAMARRSTGAAATAPPPTAPAASTHPARCAGSPSAAPRAPRGRLPACASCQSRPPTNRARCR